VLTVVFDAAPLITACEFEVQGVLVIDRLLPECRIVIAPSVEEEVAILGAQLSRWGRGRGAHCPGRYSGEGGGRAKMDTVPRRLRVRRHGRARVQSPHVEGIAS
jgi:hypothetical protein